MENENPKPKDVLRDLGENLAEIGQKIGKKVSEIMDDFSAPREGEEGEIRVKADVYENGTHYVIELELPGVSKDQVKISATDNILTIKGRKSRGGDLVGLTYYRRERNFGAFIRAFELPEGIELDNIKAKFNDGLLLVQFPKNKKEEAEEITSVDIE